jgi:hypothetical protein
MQPTKKLTAVLRDLVTLIEDEAAHNPGFAASLDDILSGLPSRVQRARRSDRQTPPPTDIPDVFAALAAKGEEEFRFWLRSIDLPALKAIIKMHGFDPGKAAQHWTDPDKFLALVADQTISRMKRGSAFLRPKAAPSQQTDTTTENPNK